MSKISVAMATYCGERYVEEQLQSLLSQTRPPDEVMIFDDRSGDRTAEIVLAFIQKNGLANWHFTVNEQNLGFIANFKQAIAAVTGDLIFLCDQDDIWNPDKLEDFERIFNGNPDIMAVNGSFDFIDGEGKPIPSVNRLGTCNHDLVYHELTPGEVLEIPYLEILRGNISPGCCMAFRSTLKAYYLQHATGLIPHDWELNIFACEIGTTVYYNHPVIRYRIHAQNAIGLKIGDGKTHLTISSTEEKRLKVFHDQENLAEFLRTYVKSEDLSVRQYIRHFQSYVNLRRKCLIKHNPFVWPLFWKHYKYLLPNITKRPIFGDLIYALHLQKLFERT